LREEADQRRHLVVGEVAQNSALLELRLRQLLTALIDSKYAGLVSAGMSMSDLMDNCRALAAINEEIETQERDEILDTLGQLKPVVTLRNNLVHGLWVPRVGATNEYETPSVALISKRRAGNKAVEIPYDLAQRTAFDLALLGRQIYDWTFRVLHAQANRPQVNP
jgi:hypothetical protein